VESRSPSRVRRLAAIAPCAGFESVLRRLHFPGVILVGKRGGGGAGSRWYFPLVFPLAVRYLFPVCPAEELSGFLHVPLDLGEQFFRAGEFSLIPQAHEKSDFHLARRMFTVEIE
jgi:hypothetical protein